MFTGRTHTVNLCLCLELTHIHRIKLIIANCVLKQHIAGTRQSFKI